MDGGLQAQLSPIASLQQGCIPPALPDLCAPLLLMPLTICARPFSDAWQRLWIHESEQRRVRPSPLLPPKRCQMLREWVW